MWRSVTRGMASVGSAVGAVLKSGTVVGAADSDGLMGLGVLVFVRLGVVASSSVAVGVWSGMGGVTITEGMVERWCGVFAESGCEGGI